MFLGQEDEKSLPIILIRDHSLRVTNAYAVPSKGTSSSYPQSQVAYSISQLGHDKIVFRSDNEPALLAVKSEAVKILKGAHGIKVIEEESPVADHQANGVVERANGEFGGMARTLNDQLIFNYQWTPSTTHPIYAWLIIYASYLLTRFHVGVDGKTAYEKWKGKRFKSQFSTLLSMSYIS